MCKLFRPIVLYSILGLLGCNGTSLQTQDLRHIDAASFDGAYMSYFLPRAEMDFTATYTAKTGLLSITNKEAATILADYSKHYHMVYNHAALSNDEVEIVTDQNGLLVSASSTTDDQTSKLIEAIGTVVSEAGALSKAVQAQREERREESLLFEKAVDQADDEKKLCPHDLKTAIKVDFNDIDYTPQNPNSGRYGAGEKIQVWGPIEKNSGKPACALRLQVKEHKITRANILQANAFELGNATKNNYEYCKKGDVVCFRLAGAFEFTVVARLMTSDCKDPDGDGMCPVIIGNRKVQTETKVRTLAPVASLMGYAKFNRRNFVKNSTTLSFTNGMLTGLKSSDPSEVVGFFSIPVEVLKTTTILVEL